MALLAAVVTRHGALGLAALATFFGQLRQLEARTVGTQEDALEVALEAGWKKAWALGKTLDEEITQALEIG